MFIRLLAFAAFLNYVLYVCAGATSFRGPSLVNFPTIQKRDRASPSEKHRFIVAVQQKQSGLDELKELLWMMADPLSVAYGNHLSREDINSLVSDVTAIEGVLAYLSSFNGENVDMLVLDRTIGGEYLVVEASVKTLEALLRTEFYVYENTKTKVRMIRAEEYTIPGDIKQYVHSLLNIVDLMDVQYSSVLPSSAVEIPAVGGGLVAGSVTPQLLNEYYVISNNNGSKLASQALFEADNQTYSPSDLTDFQTFFNLPQEEVAQDVNGHTSNNACNSDGGNNCIEANLDVQYMMGVSQITPTTYYYFTGESWVNFLYEVANMTQPPLVFSISYVGAETLYTSEYMELWNSEALKLSAMGITIVSASGDDGVAGYMARDDPQMCGYFPMFPCSSEYVVCVGATQGPETNQPEKACMGNQGGVITTGGGFSTLQAQPSWQEEAVAVYFSTVTESGDEPFPGYASGRAYPDVSLLGYNYLVYIDGEQEGVSGTSASTPVFAAMVSLVNAARLDANKSSLGWISPSLWSLSEQYVLVDVTNGTNNCAAHGVVCCEQGFTAAPGWDPLTGWGSVNFTAFHETFFALGDEPNIPTAAPSVLPGVPTAQPVLEPTEQPSEEPSASPTLSGGYVYFTTYEDPWCDSPATAIESFPTNICLPAYSDANSNELIGYIKYSCDDIHWTKNYYLDSACSTANVSSTQEFFLGCATISPVDDSFTKMGYSSMCTDDAANIPIAQGSNYVVSMYYDTAAGCEGLMSGSLTVLNMWCIDKMCGADPCSIMYDWPYLKTYSGTGCVSEEPVVDELSTACAAFVPQDDDDYYDRGVDALFMQYSFLELAGDDDMYSGGGGGGGGGSGDDKSLALGLGLGISLVVLLVCGGAFFYWLGCCATIKGGQRASGFARGDASTMQMPLTNAVRGSENPMDGYL